MKIAIAATSSKSDATVDPRGARAPCYLIFETETGLSEVWPNPAAEAEKSAGIHASEFLISKGIEMVIAAEFGPRFSTLLENAGVACKQKSGPVSEILLQLKE